MCGIVANGGYPFSNDLAVIRSCRRFNDDI